MSKDYEECGISHPQKPLVQCTEPVNHNGEHISFNHPSVGYWPNDESDAEEDRLESEQGLRKKRYSPVEEYLGRQVENETAEAMEMRTVEAAIALKLAGASYAEIADTLDMDSPAIARRAVERGLARTIDETTDLKGMRALVSLQIDALTRSVWNRATDDTDPEHLSYARAALALLDRKSKLHGLDAPVIHLVNPNAQELEQWVESIAEEMGINPVEEGDIFVLEEGPTQELGVEDDRPGDVA